MDDAAIFTAFLTNVAGVTTPRARNELLTFVNTFSMLLASTEKEIDSFVKATHASNSARAANGRILIPTGAIIALKAVMFELKDRERCGAIPTAAMLQGLDVNQVTELRARMNAAKQDELQASIAPPTLNVPTLNATNFDSFITAFESLASSIIGSSGVQLSYLMRATDGNYEGAWTSRAERLKACARLNGPHFRQDRETLYSLFLSHIGTTGIGSDIVNRHKRSKDGYTCYLELNRHFRNDSYLENMASLATTNISKAIYKGDRAHFTIETYYNIMSKSFNDLDQAGSAHSLTEQQKITKFEQGLKDKTAITWAITAKAEWNNLPLVSQTFDGFYNCFSKYMTKFRTLANETPRTSRIANVGIHSGRGRGGRSGRSGRHGGRGRGRGRYGRGRRSGHAFSPYSFTPPNDDPNFRPESRVYSSDEWRALSRHQRQQVQNLKSTEGWVNGSTPPPGCVLDQHGFATASTSLVAAISRSISATQSQQHASLPPAPSGNPIQSPLTQSRSNPHGASVPPVINTNASQAGSSFGRQGTRVNSSDATQVSQVSMVTINGQHYNGPVFDANNNRIA